MAGPPDERKPVTALFTDLVGSTELATRQDPEQLRAMLAAFFDEMREADPGLWRHGREVRGRRHHGWSTMPRRAGA